jgi:hypothetical protein
MVGSTMMKTPNEDVKQIGCPPGQSQWELTVVPISKEPASQLVRVILVQAQINQKKTSTTSFVSEIVMMPHVVMIGQKLHFSAILAATHIHLWTKQNPHVKLLTPITPSVLTIN